jgi:hypothetical protein
MAKLPKIPTAEMKKAVEEFKAKFTPGYYHASPSNKIKIFDPASARKGEELTTPGVSFFSPNPKWADKNFLPYGNEGYKEGATMYPVSINMGKHFDPTSPEAKKEIHKYATKRVAEDLTPESINNLNKIAPGYADVVAKEMYDVHTRGMQSGAWDVVETPAFVQHLRDEGYDTFSVSELGQKGNIGVLEPHNIRGKFADFDPAEAMNPDFMKAEGGAVEGYAPGGLVKLLKHAHGQNPKVAQALEEYLKGNISQEDRIRILNQNLPIRKWSDLPPNYTDEQIRNALMANKQAKALAPVPAGAKVGNRLDIPAYTQHGVYVDTTHDVAGKPISYGRTGHLKDVEFSSKPNQAVRVGLGTKEQALTPMGAEIGSAKSPFALIKGTNVGTSDEEVRRMMEEMLKDPRYTQIGMDPRRHSQFYDKETGLPVWAAEEKLQSGPLIIAPKQGLEITDWNDPRLNLSDFEGKKYAPGGSVIKKALEHAKSLPFVHYSTQPALTHLDPAMYGRGIKGAEAARLKNAPDIKPRSYFYVNKGEATRAPEAGLGSHKYEGMAEDIYPLHEDPAGFGAIAKQKAIDPYMMSMGRMVIDEPTHLNELERLIKGAGYKGYAGEDAGLLFHPTEVKKITD